MSSRGKAGHTLPETRSAPRLTLIAFAERVARVIRRVIGVPDYARYVAHQRAAHPECTPLSEQEFARDALTRRYNTPGSRCC